VVAQTLYSSVAERVREFGTLKAMGADDRCVGRFLVSQALGTAAIGSALGLLGSLGIGRALSSPRSPVVLTWQVALFSVVMMVLVCLFAACLPYWRIRQIDPASVLRS
jgi:putative ABC transport system permease protein